MSPVSYTHLSPRILHRKSSRKPSSRQARKRPCAKPLKTAYEMESRDWSSDVCSSDLSGNPEAPIQQSLKIAQLGVVVQKAGYGIIPLCTVDLPGAAVADAQNADCLLYTSLPPISRLAAGYTCTSCAACTTSVPAIWTSGPVLPKTRRTSKGEAFNGLE